MARISRRLDSHNTATISVPSPETLKDNRLRGLPLELQGAKLERVTDIHGEPIDKSGFPHYRLVHPDDSGPETCVREPRRPIPGTGGAAIELAFETTSPTN